MPYDGSVVVVPVASAPPSPFPSAPLHFPQHHHLPLSRLPHCLLLLQLPTLQSSSGVGGAAMRKLFWIRGRKQQPAADLAVDRVDEVGLKAVVKRRGSRLVDNSYFTCRTFELRAGRECNSIFLALSKAGRG
jgi:hypothetical protein